MISPDQEIPPQSPAPDWEAIKEDLKCPLCDYNLRGLAEPRCPECGFKFTWQELFDADRDRHQYLFEDHPKRNIWSFFKTFCNDCRPRRFWRELSPARPVNVRRLLIYWVIANIPWIGLVASGVVMTVIITAMENQSRRSFYSTYPPAPGGNGIQVPITPPMMQLARRPPATSRSVTIITNAQINQWAPRALSWRFVTQAWNNLTRISNELWPFAAVLCWPWATLLSLLIFQASMRRAKIKPAHVLRCAIYGCDFAFFSAVLIILFLNAHPHNPGNPGVIILAMLLFAMLTCYRVGFAYQRYLRFDHPFLTVLASQTIVFLAFFVAVLNL